MEKLKKVLKSIVKAFLALLGGILIGVLPIVILYFGFGFIATLSKERPPSGYYHKEEYYDETGWQDFTDYCKYYYKEKDDDKFIKNQKYSYVNGEIVTEVVGYFENFEGWMLPEREDEYDFDKSWITVGDYVYIDDKEGESIGESRYMKYQNYNVYFYDIETHTLYYIHNNI